MEILSSLNWLAVIVAGVLYFVLGALWYSPLLFASPFMRFRGMTREQLQSEGNPAEYLITLVNSLIVAVVMGVLARLLGSTTLVDGLGLGLLCAVGFALTTSLTFTIFSGPHKGLWVIYAGYKLVGFVVVGLLITLWR
jgi:Protein of unknown function (DUF1761)